MDIEISGLEMFEQEFYSKLFDWQFDTGMPDYAMLGAQGDGIGGGIMQTPAEARPYVTFYVSVEDLAATLARAESLGATTVVPPTPIPGTGAFAMFADPGAHDQDLQDGLIAGPEAAQATGTPPGGRRPTGQDRLRPWSAPLPGQGVYPRAGGAAGLTSRRRCGWR
jgi:hypothetical protein